jgi:hypothetical protein
MAYLRTAGMNLHLATATSVAILKAGKRGNPLRCARRAFPIQRAVHLEGVFLRGHNSLAGGHSFPLLDNRGVDGKAI